MLPLNFSPKKKKTISQKRNEETKTGCVRAKYTAITSRKALHKKLKFCTKDFFSKCDQIRRKLQETTVKVLIIYKETLSVELKI